MHACSIVSIHTRGSDLKSGSSLRGSLHLVDLAGSERVDRSEVTGDRLKEAQHINKSLSALGDVIFALSQKTAHVPYRNSKLTQVLQSSLGTCFISTRWSNGWFHSQSIYKKCFKMKTCLKCVLHYPKTIKLVYIILEFALFSSKHFSH